jgi:hypothetical protein
LQHPTSHPTTKSTQTTNAAKKNILPLLAVRHGKLTKSSTPSRHQANDGNCGSEAQRVLALGALRSVQSKMKLVAEKQ